MSIDFVYAAVMFSFCCSVLYVIGYTLLAPWWKNPQGRGMVSFSAAISLVELPSVLRILFGFNISQPFFRWYYVCSFFAAGAIEIYRLVISYRIQQRYTPYKDLTEESRENDQNLLR